MVLGPAEPQRCGLTAQIGGRGHVPVARQLGLALPLRALRAPGEQDIEHSRLVLEGQVYVRVLRNGTVGDAEVRLRRQVDHVLRGREQEEGRSRGVRTLGFGRKLARRVINRTVTAEKQLELNLRGPIESFMREYPFGI